jgi:hypothetical protein
MYLLILFLLIGCAKQGTVLPYEYKEAVNWLSLIKNDDDILSKYQLKIVTAMASDGYYDESFYLASKIKDYRRPLAYTIIGLESQKKGLLNISRKALSSAENTLGYGVGWQRDEGTLAALGLSYRLDDKGKSESLMNGFTSDEYRTRAKNLILSFEVKNSGKSNLPSSGPKEVKASSSGNDAERHSGTETPGKTNIQDILSDSEQALLNDKKDLLKLCLDKARSKIPTEPSIDRVHHRIALCRLDFEAGNEVEAKKAVPIIEAELSEISASAEFKYQWIIEFASVMHIVGYEKESDELIKKSIDCIIANFQPFVKTRLLNQIATASSRLGMTDCAAKCWEIALNIAEQNPNPRSRVIGVIDYLLSHAEAHKPISLEVQDKLKTIKKDIIPSYKKLPGFQGN